MLKNIVIFCSLLVLSLSVNSVFAEQPLSPQAKKALEKEVAQKGKYGLELKKFWLREIAKIEESEGLKIDKEMIKTINFIIKTFPREPFMLKVSFCESSLQHKKRGELLKGSDGHDLGAFQIRKIVHKKQLQKMGLNLENEEDYFKFSRTLFNESNTRPWNSSRHCWEKDKKRIIKALAKLDARFKSKLNLAKK